MSISLVSAASAVQSYQPLQQLQAAGRDPDHDGDNEATETAAAKAQEAAKSVNPNLGNTINITV